ncbi:unnamed protein product [Rotaria socialis]|uniref:Uncharacterized protein n=3 Tax=Rotaria socialis TaxID=392032 RepID=A0A818UX92_9BILA|nr:unnamed protein product [Rotaria socialis]CAF3698064.1 unnamed protein product [Rotaria socialis]CAF4557159.1 unnamed protein product [Rotaria socialis]CAF4878389.1 unnamed protein product [Rotaria socialis]
MSSLENKSYLATKNTNSHNCAIVQTTTEMIRNSTDSQIKIDNNTKEDKMMLNIIINTIDEIDYYDDDEEIDENKDEIKNQMDAGQMKLSLLLSGMELDDIYSYLSFFLISMMSTIRVRKPTARRGVARTTTNDLPFFPLSPTVSTSMNAYLTNNVENGSQHTSEKQIKKKKIEESGDQVVPQAGCNKHKQLPVIEHNGLNEYYRSPPDAPVFRYSNSSSRISNNQQQPEIISSRMDEQFIYVD